MPPLGQRSVIDLEFALCASNITPLQGPMTRIVGARVGKSFVTVNDIDPGDHVNRSCSARD